MPEDLTPPETAPETEPAPAEKPKKKRKRKPKAAPNPRAVEISAIEAAVSSLNEMCSALTGVPSGRMDPGLLGIMTAWQACQAETLARLERIKGRK